MCQMALPFKRWRKFMSPRVRTAWLLCCGALMLGGCAGVPSTIAQSTAPVATDEVSQCQRWFSDLDSAVVNAGVRDAGAAVVDGFPYLRVNRFLSSFRGQLNSDEAFAVWLERMRSLDASARRVEIANLPTVDRVRLAYGGLVAAGQRVDRCGKALMANDAVQIEQRARLTARAVVADDYVAWWRVAGAYAVTQIAFHLGIRQLEADTLAAFAASSRDESVSPDSVVRYQPVPEDARTGNRVRAMLSALPHDALGVPQLTEAHRQALLAAHAPVIEVVTTGEHDRIGYPEWLPSRLPGVDSARPTVFARQEFTRYGDAVLVQLVYTAWFSERPASHAGDVLAGALDGIVLRVTLAPDGEPLLYDSIHPCGCYHQFFPTPRVTIRPAPNGLEEWAFSPAQLPRIADRERIRVRVASRTHYLIGIGTESASGDDAKLKPGRIVGYALVSDDELRSLPHPVGGTRSLFGPNGVVAGSERPERALFWPTGIVSAGAMRQWGRHATAFVGRRHFDDADLIERRFDLRLAEPAR